MPEWLKEIFPTVSAVTIALLGILGNYLINRPKTDVERSKERREVKDDWREETKDLWGRLELQDAKLEAQSKKIAERDDRIETQSKRISELGNALGERDTKIALLEASVKELIDYKAKYQDAMFINNDLRHQLRDYEQLRARVAELERELEALKGVQ